MNLGANVLVLGVMLRFELDRWRVVRGGAIIEFMGEKDWVREWPTLVVARVGEITIDFGLTLAGRGPGDGDIEPRLNGLLRHIGP